MPCAKHGYAVCHFGCTGGDARGWDRITPDHGISNYPTLTEYCFSIIGRTDIEGSKSKVAMNAWLPQASSIVRQLDFLPQDIWHMEKPQDIAP